MTRNALAYLNARYFEKPGQEAVAKGILDAALLEGLPEVPVDIALANLFIGVANIATALLYMRFKETGVAPSQTFADLGRLFAPPGE
jgi:hypothetical protein